MATVALPPIEDEVEIIRPRMTLAEFNSLADDPCVDRFLLRGELWELPMTKRNRWHARAEARLGQLLLNWRDQHAPGLMDVLSGEAGCDFPDQDTGVGIDVAVFSAELLAAQDPEAKFVVGAPILAVEILSPSDTQELVAAKVREYLHAGVKFVWLVDPDFQTVTVHQPGGRPTMYRDDDELNGDPHLPGLRIRIASIFS